MFGTKGFPSSYNLRGIRKSRLALPQATMPLAYRYKNWVYTKLSCPTSVHAWLFVHSAVDGSTGIDQFAGFMNELRRCRPSVSAVSIEWLQSLTDCMTAAVLVVG